MQDLRVHKYIIKDKAVINDCMCTYINACVRERVNFFIFTMWTINLLYL